MTEPLLTFTPNGIYCSLGDFYIDPWKKVKKAVITHAHSDHSRRGMGQYIAHKDSIPVMKLRLGKKIDTLGVDFGEKLTLNGVNISFHPAGHIIGSAQIRVEHQGQVAVASGDYKVEDDGISGTFEPIKCHQFISETTFGLPIYRWQPQQAVADEINTWWASNAANNRPTVLSAYALGKAQRLSELLDRSIGPVYTDDAIHKTHVAFREHGIDLKPTLALTDGLSTKDLQKAVIIGAGAAFKKRWAEALGNFVTGSVSGWNATRTGRKWRPADRGFVLSDHAGWDGLNEAILATGAERVHLTHGYSEEFARWLTGQGIEAYVEETLFEGGNVEISGGTI